MFLVVTLSAKDKQNLAKLLSKGFERSVYQNEYKTKSENKIQVNLDIFLNQIFLESMDSMFQLIQMKITILKDLILEDITYERNYWELKRHHQWKKPL